MKPILLKVLASAAMLTIAACAVQPETHADLPQTVKTVAPAAWNVEAPQDSVSANAWWAQFGDPVMHQLVETVLTGNLDVQAAVERVKQAQDLATQDRAALLPE
jgi:outer membrane protein TolC